MAVHEYKLPDPGEGLTEAEIVAWRVAVGDVVAVNDIVVEVETAKSVVELPTPYAGTVAALLVSEGETVAVGTPIIAVADEAGEAAAPEAPAPAGATGAPAGDEDPGAPQTLVGYGPKAGAGTRRPRRGAATPASAAGAAAQEQVQGVFESGPGPEPDAPFVPRSRRCRRVRPRSPATGRARRPCACWPSPRCASLPRTSASTSARSCRPVPRAQ